jgi:hypothetical protein
MHFYEKPDIPMLFDLADDEGETNNIADQSPEQHKFLYQETMRYFDEVGARLPKENPDYDPEQYKRLTDFEQRMAWGPFLGRRELSTDRDGN